MEFSTPDRRNDKSYTDACTTFAQGAWWYNDCMASNLNGRYQGFGFTGNSCLGFAGDYRALKTVVMMVRGGGTAISGPSG